MSVEEDVRMESCIGTKAEILALSVIDMDVGKVYPAGYSMRMLSGKPASSLVFSTHPPRPQAGFQQEKVSTVLGGGEIPFLYYLFYNMLPTHTF